MLNLTALFILALLGIILLRMDLLRNDAEGCARFCSVR